MRECWNWQTGRLEVPVSYHRRVGSSPISRTNKKPCKLNAYRAFFFLWYTLKYTLEFLCAGFIGL